MFMVLDTNMAKLIHHAASILEEMAPAIVQNLVDAQNANEEFFLKNAVT